MYEIKLEYFKRSGKFYTEAIYETKLEWMFDISDEIRNMRRQEILPGISGGEWIIHVNADKVPHGYPLLIL